MRLECNRDDFLQAVRITQNALISSTLPILSYILLSTKEDQVQVVATNLETTIGSFFKAEVEEEGEICLPGSKLYSILREMPPGRVQFKKEELKSSIKMGEILFTLLGSSPEEFPEIPSPGKTTFSLPQSTLQEIFEKTIFSAGQDEVRQNLNCVFLETFVTEEEKKSALRAVATDGRRLSLLLTSHPSVSQSFNVLIPLKAIRQLMKILKKEGEIAIGMEENRIFFQTPEFSFFSQLIDAKFPNYRGVIPENYRVSITVGKEELIAAIKRTSLLAEEQTRLVRFDVNGDTLSINATSAQLGSAHESLPVERKGEERMEIGFNSVYLLEALRAIEAESIEIHFVDRESAGVFHPKDSQDYIHVLMPVKLKGE